MELFLLGVWRETTAWVAQPKNPEDENLLTRIHLETKKTDITDDVIDASVGPVRAGAVIAVQVRMDIGVAAGVTGDVAGAVTAIVLRPPAQVLLIPLTLLTRLLMMALTRIRSADYLQSKDALLNVT